MSVGQKEQQRRGWQGAGLLAAAMAAGTLLAPALAGARELTLYSARKEELIRPAIEAFQKETGIRVTLLTAAAGELARRVELERGSPKGDVFLGTAAGITELLRQKGLLEAYASPHARELPEEFRAPDHAWVGITGRVRVLIYNTDRVKAAEAPQSYFDLTAPRWKGQVAVASMGERTTVGWLAALLALKGEAATRQYVDGLRANGLKVLKNNTEVRHAVARGEVAVGITNHYYYMLQLQEDPRSPIAIVYPDQGPHGMGTPVFSITAGIIKGAPHPAEARALIDFLLKPAGNRLLVEGEFEIPLLPQVALVGGDRGIRGLGQFKKAAVTQIELAEFEPKVERLFGSVFIP
ncbi:MAG TPA: extracellular solute-binding protein [Candidatus Methylomirabilis sp.]|jgi:iron(III) transport system substrate-binding protein|nr:extracellular solute-binding protein [Candidatus Methylomirabilis sp.]